MWERKSEDWFEAGIKEMEPAITAKRTALLKHKKQPSKETLAAYRAARNNVKRIAHKCANDYWLNLCHSIQIASDCGNICAMYERMKKAFGPSAIKIAPLSPRRARSSQTAANRWSDGQSIIRSCTLGRPLSPTPPSITPPYPPWKSLTHHPQSMS